MTEMKIHKTIDEVPVKYATLAREVGLLAVGKILPVECEDGRERKRVFDFLRYHYPDLCVVAISNFVYASKEDSDDIRYPARRTARRVRREAAHERGAAKVLRPTTPRSHPMAN